MTQRFARVPTPGSVEPPKPPCAACGTDDARLAYSRVEGRVLCEGCKVAQDAARVQQSQGRRS